MAYREDLDQGKLKAVRSLLVNIGSLSTYGQMMRGDSFLVANGCIEFLADVKHLTRELAPELSKWHSWGPGYYHEFEYDDTISHHVLGFGFFPKKYSERRFDCCIYFPVAKQEPIVFYLVHRYGDKERDKTIKISNFLSKRSLDAHKFAHAIAKSAQDWGIA